MESLNPLLHSADLFGCEVFEGLGGTGAFGFLGLLRGLRLRLLFVVVVDDDDRGRFVGSTIVFFELFD